MGNRRSQKKTTPVSKRATASSSSSGGGPSWVKWLLIGGVVIALGALVVFIASDVSDNPQGQAEAPPGVQTIAVDSADHTEDPVAYPTDPPVGGAHDPVWLNCRVYDEPVRNENAVHALEHGAVWIAYDPDLDASDVERLEDEFGRSSEVIVSPYPGLEHPVSLASWGRLLEMDSVDLDIIDRFVRAFRDQTAPEAGATC
jgi:hypothetical protein